MDPASKEYFLTYEMLTEELNSFKIQQSDLKFQISKLFEENKRLTNELKENVVTREQSLSETGFADLERKYHSALASKDAAIQMWQEALQQLEKQEQQLIGKKSILECERSETDKKIEQMKDEYAKGLNILSAEVTNYRIELKNKTRDFEQKTSEFDKCKNDLEKVICELTENKTLVSELSTKSAQLEEQNNSLDNLLLETEKFLSATKEDMTASKAENSDLVSLVADLREQNKHLRTEIAIFEKNAKESILTAQEAVLQRKEMTFREEQYSKEIGHLKQVVDIETEKVAFKFRAELKEAQKQCEGKINTLMDEIQTLHQENSDKQSLFEKAVREKQALESKMELLYSEFAAGVPSSSGTFDDLCKRLTMAERTRDECELKIRTLESDLQELRSGKELDLQHFHAEQNALKTRLCKLSEDFNQSSSDRIKLSDEVSKLKKLCYHLEKELDSTRSRRANEISEIKEEASRKLKSLNERLHSNEEQYKIARNEFQILLNAEFKMSSRWKDEVDDLITKSESKINELCQTIINLQNQNRELVNAVGHFNSYSPNWTGDTANKYTSFNVENV